MFRLSAGVLLWSGLHFLPAVDPRWREGLLRRLGENAYKAVFSLAMLLAIWLMVTGWKSVPPVMAYWPPGWGQALTLPLMWVAAVAFFAPYRPHSLRRVVRHPQLTAVAVFGAAHLLSVGQQRAILLFGGLALWAVVEILLINRRDGAWDRPGPAPLKNDLALLALGSIVYLVFLLFAHAWLFGVDPLAMGG